MSLTFLLGGARSGKTALAVELARRTRGPVSVIATAERGDMEMEERIRLHRAERPAEWQTIEEPRELAAAIAGVDAGATLVVDCLTLWVANVIESGDVEAENEKAIGAVRARAARTIVVSNEVGLGIVPANELARRFRDVLGRVNAAWAAAADDAALVVAGRILPLS